MKRYLVLAGALCLGLASNNTWAQTVSKRCGNEIIQTEIDNDPVLKAKFDQYYDGVVSRSDAYNQKMANTANKTTADAYYIPLVFHVILTQAEIDQLGGTQVIYQRIQSQVNVLNEDYNNGNADVANVPTAFQSVLGKADINFGLAHTDPNGSGTTGVEIKVAADGFGGFAVGDVAAKRNNAGGLNPWDYTKYLNIWVVNLTSGQANGTVLGYGYSPSYASAVGSVTDAGVVIMYSTLGSRLNSPSWYFWGDQQFSKSTVDRGRTLTHELGHYFNLFHTWGNTAVGAGNCNDDDGIDDTPRQEDATYSTCPSGVVPNCTNDPHVGGEMYMNFMDYSGDRCTNMFTVLQVARMRAELAPGGDSYGLTQSNVMVWPTSVSSVELNNQVSLVPNPTSGNFNISFVEKNNNLNKITVISTTGQVVKQIIPTEQKSTYSVDISGMPSGMYMVQLGFDNGIIVRKVVLQ